VSYTNNTPQRIQAATTLSANGVQTRNRGRRVEQVVARAAPMCSAAERATIEHVCLCHGDPAAELARRIRDRHIGLVVRGWHGGFMRGHARACARARRADALMRDIRCPVLLSRTRAREPFRLEVGEQFQ